MQICINIGFKPSTSCILNQVAAGGLRCSVPLFSVYTQPTSQRQVKNMELEFVRKSSQRSLASHSHKTDTQRDQPRMLIFQPELMSNPCWALLKTIAVKELRASTGTALSLQFRNILEINQALKQEFRNFRIQDARTRSCCWYFAKTLWQSPKRTFVFRVTNHELEGEDLGPLGYIPKERFHRMKIDLADRSGNHVETAFAT